jgi:AraC-like DNA-binding protein
MNIGQQILFLVSALGAFNGIILSLYLLLGSKRRIPAAFFLSMLLMMLSIRVGKAVFVYFNPQLPKIYLQIGLTACFLIGPSLYYSFRSVLTKPDQVPPRWKLVWGIQAGLIVVAGILVPYPRYPGAWNHIIVYIIYLQWTIYMIATAFLLRHHLKTFFVNAGTLNKIEKGWLLFFLGNAVVFLAYLLSLLGIGTKAGMYISAPIFFTCVLYLTIFLNLYGAGLTSLPPSKPERKKIADNDAQLWLEKLEKVIRDNALYKDPNLKLSDLAQKINISTHQLSQLLNDNLGKSFSTYINEYRINEACKLISSSGHLTFEAIGYEVGYNSKSTFYAAFRKIKATTPALYKETLVP